MSKTNKLILTICALIILIHVWGIIDTTHLNWGVHFWGFFPSIYSLIALAVVILFAFLKFQDAIIKPLERILNKLKRLPIILNFILVLGLAVLGIYLFPAKLHLLGDGAVLLRSVPHGIMGEEITLSFRNQPLMFWIYKFAMNLHPFQANPDAYTVYYTIDIIAVIGFLILIFWAMQRLQRPIIEKVLLGCIIFFSAGSQFFFGYVENYVLQYVVTAAYAITGWYSLERRIHIVIPILFFIISVLLHLGDLVFLPSLVILILYKWKRSKLQAFIFLATVTIIGIAVLYFIGFNLVDMTRHLRSGSVDFLQPFTAIGGQFPYPMFSLTHLLDWFNEHMLVVPFGIFLPVVLIPALPKERRWKNPILIFLLSVSACGIFFTWIINSALGLARDWDLFSSFFLPLLILDVYLLSQVNIGEKKVYALTMIVVTMLFHTIPWIGVNASAEKHLARMRILDNPILLSKAARMAYFESLANYYFDTQQYNEAKVYYLRYMEIDKNNPRIIGNISDVYRRLGDKDNYFNMLLYAVKINSPDAGIYSNLGVEYASRGDTANAIKYNEIAISKNPMAAKAYANLGVLYMSQKDFVKADGYFTTAIKLGMSDPLLFAYSGDVAIRLNDYKRALNYYDYYLSANPSDKHVREIRNKIAEYLRREKK